MATSIPPYVGEADPYVPSDICWSGPRPRQPKLARSMPRPDFPTGGVAVEEPMRRSGGL
jgi:hypothetical protein